MLNASVIYSNSRTKVLLIVSIILLPFGLGTTYFLVSNASWCLNLGATGLAIKTILIEFVSVIIILYINSKYLNMLFYKYVFHLVAIISIFLFLGIVSKFLSLLFLTNTFEIFLFSGFLYLLFCLLLLYLTPKIYGLDNLFIQNAINKIRKI
jgi:hypothetical protein